MNWIYLSEAERPADREQVLVKFGILQWSVAIYDADADAFMQPDFGQQFWCAYEDVVAWARVDI